MKVSRARVWDDSDYERVKKLCDEDDGWVEVYKKKDRRIFRLPSSTTTVSMYKARVEWHDVSAHVLFDVLHDPDYRTKWDKHMTQSIDIGIINPNNDVGYYAVRSVPPLRPRDFVLQRSWLDEGREKLLCSRSICHDDYPPRPGHIRATIFLSGYLVRELDKGCSLCYVTQADPGGQIPTWLTNRVSKVMAPKVLDRLHKAAVGYPAWKAHNKATWKPWIYPDQLIDCSRIDLSKCEPREYKSEVKDGSGSEGDEVSSASD